MKDTLLNVNSFSIKNEIEETTDYSDIIKNDPDSNDDYNMIVKDKDDE